MTAYRRNYRGPSSFDKVEPGDHCSITVKSGESIQGVVIEVSDAGVALEYERWNWRNDWVTDRVTIPWTNQRARRRLGGA